MNDDSLYRQAEIQQLFDEEQLQANSDDVLEEQGMNEWVNPYENQPRPFAVGNYAHENAEQFIPDLPPDLDSERTIKTDNGTVRIDRMDWDENIYEIKPETTSERTLANYQDQVDKQVEMFTEAYPDYDSPTGHVVTYDRQEVENEMIDKGLLSPLPENQSIDNSSESNVDETTPESNIDNSIQTTSNLENTPEEQSMINFEDKKPKDRTRRI